MARIKFLMKLSRSILLSALVLLSLSSNSCAQAIKKAPLYTGPEGWTIVSSKSGLDLSEPYMMAREKAHEMGIGSPEVPGLLYISKDPLSIFAFVVKVPDGKRLIWPINSEITIFYAEDGDTLSSTSVEFFVCGEFTTPFGTLPGKVVSSNEMAGDVPIPNDWLYVTPNGNPVVFARFPFGKEPHNLLWCTVANVQVTDRR